MPSYRTTRRVPFTPRQMFDLVADVETYPQFLPLCEALAVKSRERDGDKEIVIAQMTVGYMAIHETFTSRVVLDLPGQVVEAGAMPGAASGPFSRLHNRWAFLPITLAKLSGLIGNFSNQLLYSLTGQNGKELA